MQDESIRLCACGCGQALPPPRGAGFIARYLYGHYRSVHKRTGRVLGIVTHGESRLDARTPEYMAWLGMKTRCHNPRNKDYVKYGGRGITVCDRWRNSYEAFLADVGRRPSPEHSLDRTDVNGNYEPSNVRWATRTEQGYHRQGNRMVTFNGETYCVAEWARRLGVNPDVLFNRLHRWGTERALTTH